MSYALALRMLRQVALAIPLALVACGGSSRSTTPKSEPAEAVATEPAAPAIDLIALDRGAYLAQITGCVTCHTPRDANGNLDTVSLLGGGLEAPGPLGKGVWRAPNISPDPRTGIGAWTPEQLDGALRRGVRPSGHALAPIMPSAFFARMTDADASALITWLRAQRPVVHKVARSSGLDMPDGFAAVAMGGAGDSATDQRAHGEYLATIMHCSGCHTPTEGAHKDQLFAGGNAFDRPLSEGGGSVYAANLTPDPRTGIGNWTQEDIIAALREMHRPDGEPLVGPMLQYKDAYAKLTDDDARAIAVYLKSVPAVENTIVQAQRERRFKGKKVATVVRTSTP
jgi:mono/diheme cytochrome c family protein